MVEAMANNETPLEKIRKKLESKRRIMWEECPRLKISRLKVPNGWLVKNIDGTGLAFIPDPDCEWGSLE